MEGVALRRTKKLYYLCSLQCCSGYDQGGRAGWGVWHTRKGSEMYTEVVLGNQKGRDSLDDLDVDGSIILEWILTK